MPLTHVYECVCVYIYIYICLCVYICVYMHTHTVTHALTYRARVYMYMLIFATLRRGWQRRVRECAAGLHNAVHRCACERYWQRIGHIRRGLVPNGVYVCMCVCVCV